MVCRTCGAGNNDTASFCIICGTGLKNTYAHTQQTYYVNVTAKGYPSQNEWTAYIGMISGILSVAGMLFTLMVPIFVIFSMFFCFVTGIGGIALGAIGLKTNHKGMAIAGLCCGIAGIVLEVVAVIIIWSAILAFLSFV